MIVVAGDFQKVLARRARTERENSPELMAAYRRAQLARRWPLWCRAVVITLVAATLPLAIPAGLVALPCVIMFALHDALGTDGFFGVTGLVATFATLGFTFSLQGSLSQSKLLTVVSHLPMSDTEIARRTWISVTAWFAIGLYLSLWAFGCVAWAEAVGAAGWGLALGLAVLQWLVGLAIGTLLAVLIPRFPSGAVLYIGILLASVWGVVFHGAGWSAVVPVVYRLFPAGWVNGVFGLAYLKGAAGVWWGLAPCILLAILGVGAVMKLLRVYRIREFVVRGQGIVFPVTQPGSPACNHLERRIWSRLLRSPSDVPIDGGVWRDDESAVRRIRERQFLKPRTSAAGGFVNRLLRACLTERECVLFDYMSGESRFWMSAEKFLVPAVILLQVLQWLGPPVLLRFVPQPIGPFLSPLLLLPACLVALPLILIGPWFGFLGQLQGGACIARYALLPLGFDEISRLMVKVAGVRALVLAPVLIAATTGPATMFDLLWLEFVVGIAMGLCFVVVGQAWLVAVHFAESMRPPSLWLRNVHWLAAWFFSTAFGSFVAAYLVAIVFVLVLHNQPAAFQPFVGGVAVLLLAASSFAFWLLARRMYQQGAIDLVRTKPSPCQNLLRRFEEMDQSAARNRELRRRYGWFWFLRGDLPAV